MIKILEEALTMTKMPEYMGKGSDGVHVYALKIFLFGAGLGTSLMLDQRFDGLTVDALQSWQLNHDIEPTGILDPETRKVMDERYHFDFELVALQLPDITVFVQPDGQRTPWSPEED